MSRPSTVPPFRIERLDAVAVLTLDCPPVNALGAHGYRQVRDALTRLDSEAGVRAIVVTGAGERAFCAGTDLAEFEGGDVDQLTAAALAFFEALSGLGTPLIGALNGPAVGGGAMIAAECDVLVAVARAYIAIPELQLGFPGAGSHLARLVPRPVALRMLLLAERVDARRLLELGTLAAVTSDAASLREMALQYALAIAALDPDAVAGTRSVLRRDADARALAGYREELDLLRRVLRQRRRDPSRHPYRNELPLFGLGGVNVQTSKSLALYSRAARASASSRCPSPCCRTCAPIATEMIPTGRYGNQQHTVPLAQAGAGDRWRLVTSRR